MEREQSRKMGRPMRWRRNDWASKLLSYCVERVEMEGDWKSFPDMFPTGIKNETYQKGEREKSFRCSITHPR